VDAAGVRRAARRLALRVVGRRVAAARGVVAGWRGDAPAPVVALDDVRRRVELLLVALYGRAVRVEPAAAVTGGWRGRVGRALGRAAARPLPGLDGECVRLPASLDAPDGPDAAAMQYRLLAVEQAERLARGTAAWVPVDDPVARDLFLAAEGAAVDRAVAARVPGLRAALAAARRAALVARPEVARRGAAAAVEQEVRAALSGDLGHGAGAAEAPADASPGAALAWARARAATVRADAGATGRYLGVAPVAHWGAVPVAGMGAAGGADVAGGAGEDLQHRMSVPVPGTRARVAEAGEGDTRAGLAAAPAGAARAVEDPRGAPDRSDGDAAGAADAWHDPAAPRGGGADGVALGASTPAAPGGTPYPEWDHAARRYVRDAVAVREQPPPDGDGAWAAAVLGEHATLVRRIRARFEPLRARRARVGRQPRGDEVDLAAFVEAHADRAAGRGGDGDERLYVATTPARRALAILVLVDVSGSTDAPVGGGRQVIDVEKEAVLLAGAALDALGDAYAVLTFSSRGARDVRVATLRDFAERDAARLGRRVAGVRPGANTRLGAALRHAAALLARQPAGHRLLLLLSDGRPNDMDGYQGPRAVEDARQAVHEARARGVTPFCLTVDRDGAASPESRHLPHVFGAAGFSVLRRAEQLPVALVGVVRQLLGAGRL
jgi:nitric oxide reductase NorD protein